MVSCLICSFNLGEWCDHDIQFHFRDQSAPVEAREHWSQVIAVFGRCLWGDTQWVCKESCSVYNFQDKCNEDQWLGELTEFPSFATVPFVHLIDSDFHYSFRVFPSSSRLNGFGPYRLPAQKFHQQIPLQSRWNYESMVLVKLRVTVLVFFFLRCCCLVAIVYLFRLVIFNLFVFV